MRRAARIAMWFVLAGATAPLPSALADDTQSEPSRGGRTALIEFGGAPRHPSALDSIPHPWRRWTC